MKRGSMKTNKHQTLALIKEKGSVEAKDIVEAFSYSAATARSYLCHLGHQELLERTAWGHSLTDKGLNRLMFFDVEGCGDPECPRCQGKKGFYTCQSCGWKIDKSKARIKKAWDTILIKRDAGVYCGVCQNQMFTERQALTVGIRREDTQ
jgi:hypothetical protein